MVKKDLYLYVYNFIKDNQRLPKDISKQKAYYYTKQLVQRDLITNEDHGIWKVTGKKLVQKQVDVTQRKTRGHGFVFKVAFPSIQNWRKRDQEFRRLGLHFDSLKHCQRMYVLGNKINIYDECLIIYLAPSTSFYAENPEESSFRAIMYCKEIIKRFEKDVRVSLRSGKGWAVQETRSHYADVNNICAKYYKSKGVNYVPIVMNGKTWALIDNSMNLFELETILGHGQSKEDMKTLQYMLNDLKLSPTTFSKERSDFDEKLVKLGEKLDNAVSLIESNANSIGILVQREINKDTNIPIPTSEDRNLADYFG